MNDPLRDTLAQFAKPIAIVVTVAISLLALFLLVLAAEKIYTFDDAQYNTITVTGEGEAAAVPDIATITFTVEERDTAVDAAQAAATRRVDAAMAALQSLEVSVEKNDLKTLSYQITPEYDTQWPCVPGSGIACPAQELPRIIGYRVSQTIEARIRDTGKAGQALEALGAAGVQNVSGPNFRVDEDSALATEARDLAIADAREQAKRLANQLGVRLGEVTSFYEEGQSMMPFASGMGGDAMSAAPMMRAPSLPTGEQERTVRVQVTYRIH